LVDLLGRELVEAGERRVPVVFVEELEDCYQPVVMRGRVVSRTVADLLGSADYEFADRGSTS